MSGYTRGMNECCCIKERGGRGYLGGDRGGGGDDGLNLILLEEDGDDGHLQWGGHEAGGGRRRDEQPGRCTPLRARPLPPACQAEDAVFAPPNRPLAAGCSPASQGEAAWGQRRRGPGESVVPKDLAAVRPNRPKGWRAAELTPPSSLPPVETRLHLATAEIREASRNPNNRRACPAPKEPLPTPPPQKKRGQASGSGVRPAKSGAAGRLPHRSIAPKPRPRWGEQKDPELHLDNPQPDTGLVVPRYSARAFFPLMVLEYLTTPSDTAKRVWSFPTITLGPALN